MFHRPWLIQIESNVFLMHMSSLVAALTTLWAINESKEISGIHVIVR